MTRGVLTLGVMFLLVPAPAGAQTGVRLFVEGGPAADYNTPPFSISGIGVNVGGGILPTPTVSVGFNAERVKLRFNEASWWSYAVRLAKQARCHGASGWEAPWASAVSHLGSTACNAAHQP